MGKGRDSERSAVRFARIVMGLDVQGWPPDTAGCSMTSRDAGELGKGWRIEAGPQKRSDKGPKREVLAVTFSLGAQPATSPSWERTSLADFVTLRSLLIKFWVSVPHSPCNGGLGRQQQRKPQVGSDTHLLLPLEPDVLRNVSPPFPPPVHANATKTFSFLGTGAQPPVVSKKREGATLNLAAALGLLHSPPPPFSWQLFCLIWVPWGSTSWRSPLISGFREVRKTLKREWAWGHAQ